MRSRVEAKITTTINKLDSTISNLSLDTTSFNELHICSFLEQLGAKLQEQDKVLEQLTFRACNVNVLRGLNDFLQQKANTHINELILATHQTDDEEEEDYRPVFEKLLIALSTSQQTAVRIDHNLLELFTEEELLQFVNDNKITVKINLPKELENTPLQRELDEATYDNAYAHRIQGGKKQKEQQAKYQQRPKRQRLKQAGNFPLDIDVDMEKQQQKQLEVEAEKTTKELQTNHLPLQFGLTLAQFKALAQKSSENILSEFEVEQLWHRCLGNVAVIETADDRYDINNLPEGFQEEGTIKVSTNPALTGITKRASKQLLRHANQFKLGINVGHLPAGFTIKKPLHANLLDYEGESIVEKDPLAIKLQQPLPKLRVARSVYTHLLELFEGKYPEQIGLIRANHTRMIEDGDYNSTNLDRFRYYLPQMLSLDTEQLELLFQLCGVGSQCDGKRLDYLMTHYQKIAAVFANGFNEDEITATNTLVAVGFKEKHLPQLVNFCRELTEVNFSPKNYPLKIALQNNLGLLAQLSKWKTKLKLKDQQLIALWHLWVDFGDAGLEMLFQQWKNQEKENPEIFDCLHASIYATMDNYAPLLFSPQYQQAFQTLTALNKEQLHWWQALLEQHVNAVGFDDLPTLVEAFSEFTRKIAEHQLSFYQPVSFENVSSLPTALANMLTIIENCPPADKKAQWQCITALSLQSNGAVRAISDGMFNTNLVGGAKPCNFVSPEMQCDGLNYTADKDGYKGNPKTIQDHKPHFNLKTLKEDNQFDPGQRKKEFYRFLAHQPLRCSWSFYQDCIEELESNKKFSDKNKRNLYILLAKATTGATNNRASQDEDNVKANWHEVLESYSELAWLPTIMQPFKGHIRNELVKDLLKLETIPDMQTARSLLKFEEQLVSSFTIKLAFKGARKEFLAKMKQFNEITDKFNQSQQPGYIQAVLEGIKFYTELTADDMEQFFKMIEQFPQSFQKNNKSNLLISLVSTFDINPSNIARVNLLSQDKTNQKNVFYALKLLRSISDNTDLDLDKLEAFLAQLPKSKSGKANVREINQLVQSHFHKNFPAGFFEKLGGDGVDEATKKLIHKAINSPEIEVAFFAFLQQFSKNDHIALTNKILGIAELSSNIKNDLIQIIIGKNPFNFNHPDDYDPLFDAINDSQSPQSFLFFATRLQQKGTIDAEEALWKTSLFLTLSAFTQGSDFSPSVTTAINELMADAIMIQPAAISSEEFSELFTNILGVLAEKPHDQMVLLSLIKPFIVNNNEITDNLENISLLKEELTSIEDPFVLRGLCHHYAEDNQAELLLLFKKGRYQSLKVRDKQFILKVLAIHLNNKIDYKFDDLSEFLKLYTKENKRLLQSFYASSPYPSLKQVNQWFAVYDDLSKIEDAYIDFDKKMPHDSNNGFNYEKASAQAKLVKGAIVSDTELKRIETAVTNAQELTTKELLAAIQNLEPDDTATLVAYMAALLHRSCSTPEKPFEINSTQYLAVYALLNGGPKVTGQIETGEGKSRIMMLLAGCQWVRGMTVDFATSNMQLASRDYLEYQAFFNTLGAPTSLIYANSDYSEYQLDGINFSTSANLRLFRNKASSEGQEDLVIAEESKRLLLLDEGDQTFFDASTTRYNYSTDAEKNIKNMTWIYPLLMEFFALDDPEYTNRKELYDNDIDRCNEAFIAFVTLRCHDVQLQQLKALSSQQLETWHNSAMLANKLSFQVDFTIAPDQVISTENGPLVASTAYVIANNREDKQSKYSQGVHQCLEARLNRLRANPDQSKLSEVLQECETPFHLVAEKRIVYSSTNKTLLDEYSEGQIIATTGTAGLIKEREEAELLYTSPSEEGKKRQGMRFIDVPRHLPLRRKDRALRLTANREKQIDTLVESIREARDNNQPILLVCETDQESAALAAVLKARLGSENITLIDAKTSAKDEAAHVKTKAGLPGAVTISTDMLGRGTDIVLHGEANNKGLRVLASYLPKKRTLQQIMGRSGRFGAKGDSRLILDKQRLLAQLGRKKLSSQFFTATESYVDNLLAETDRQTQFERLLRFAVDDFRTELTHLFFHALGTIEDSEQEPYRAAWQVFFNELDQQWAVAWKDLQAELAVQPLDEDKINKKLEDFGSTVREEWQTLCANLNLENDLGEDAKPKLGKIFRHLSQEPEPTPMKPRLFKKYEPAHDGFAACYPKLFTQTRATLTGERKLLANTRAWWNDSGILFANLRSFLQGHVSLRQYLFGAPKTTHDNLGCSIIGSNKIIDKIIGFC